MHRKVFVLITILLLGLPGYAKAQEAPPTVILPGLEYHIDFHVDIDNSVGGVKVSDSDFDQHFCFYDAQGVVKCYETMEAQSVAQTKEGFLSVKCTTSYFCYQLLTLPDGTQYCQQFDIQEFCEE